MTYFLAAPASARHLVIDDDPAARTFVCVALEGPGVVVDEAADGPEALDLLATRRYDAVVLDMDLPSTSGVTLLGRIRATQDVPVVVFTALDDPAFAVIALEAGAADFCTKPRTGRELELRVERAVDGGRRGSAAVDAVVHDDGLSVDPWSRIAVLDGDELDLTHKEFDLLLFLSSTPGRVFARRELLEQVWHAQPDWQSVDTVTEHVYRLRQKLSRAGTSSTWIETVRGAGYRFRGRAPHLTSTAS